MRLHHVEEWQKKKDQENLLDGVLPYECDVCHRKFNDYKQLKNHR